MKDFIEKNALIIIAILSLLVAYLGYALNRKNAKYILKNEFLKKQIEAVIGLIKIIHENPISIGFTLFNNNHGSSASIYQGNIFEVERLIIHIREKDIDYFENPICFFKNSNQIFDLEPFLNDPALPANIAGELENFYSRHYQHYKWKDIAMEKIIVLNTESFKESIWEKNLDKKDLALWQGNGFAFVNFENFIQCSKNLEDSIYQFLKRINITDINFNKHFAHR